MMEGGFRLVSGVSMGRASAESLVKKEEKGKMRWEKVIGVGRRAACRVLNLARETKGASIPLFE